MNASKLWYETGVGRNKTKKYGKTPCKNIASDFSFTSVSINVVRGGAHHIHRRTVATHRNIYAQTVHNKRQTHDQHWKFIIRNLANSDSRVHCELDSS